MSNAVLAALIVACVILLVFFAWLFWTVAGIIMEIGGWVKYGWPLQLVIFLVLWAFCGGIGAKVRS